MGDAECVRAGRRRLVLPFLVFIACATSDGHVAATTSTQPSSPPVTTSPAQPASASTLIEQAVRADDVRSQLSKVVGADPLLLPSAVPPGWTADVSSAPSSFEVSYSGASGERLELSISVPNPPPPPPGGTQPLGFRGDPHGLFQQQAPDATAERFLMWNEPGRWSGDPGIANSARSDSVPYYVHSIDVTETEFWDIVNSLTPVPHAAATITVNPSSGLSDGDSVEIVLRGFGPNHRVRLSECASAESVSDGGCGPQPAQQPFVDLDDDGSGDTTFTVRADASAKPVDPTNTFPCADRCVLVAVSGLPGEPPVSAPIAFAE